jgi:hypothetical protein
MRIVVFYSRIPLILVPEPRVIKPYKLYELIKELKRSRTSIDEKIRKTIDSLQENFSIDR